MIIYVVYGGSFLCGASPTQEGAEELMAKQIERVLNNAHQASSEHGRCFVTQVTTIKVDKEPKILTLYNQTEELRAVLKGVAAVVIEVAGSIEKYRIQDTELVG